MININKNNKIPRNVINPLKLVSSKLELALLASGGKVVNIVVVVGNPLPFPIPPFLIIVIAMRTTGSMVVASGLNIGRSVVVGTTGSVAATVVAIVVVVNNTEDEDIVVVPIPGSADVTALVLDTTEVLKLVVA